jgi:hypothetical protein
MQRRIEALEDGLQALTLIVGNLSEKEGMCLGYPEHGSLEADEYIPCSQGFYEIEYDSGGDAYRWTGPSRHFHFWLFVDQSRDRIIALEIGQAVRQDLVEGIAVFANGIELTSSLERTDKRWILRSTLPGAPLPSPLPVKLQYSLTETLVPADAGLSDDVRRLGLTFYRLDVGNA